MHDEELAACAVGVHAAGHADDTTGVLERVVHAVSSKLTLDVPARAAGTATVFFCLFAAGLFVQAIQNSVQFPMIVNMLVVLLVGLVLRLFPAFVMGAYIIKSTTAAFWLPEISAQIP